MKILFTFPGPFYKLRIDKFKQYVPPLGISVLSAYIKQFKHKTRLIDLRLLRSWEEYKEQISLFKPEVIGFSVVTSDLEIVIEAINYVAQEFPKIKIIVGGPHATVLTQESAQIPHVYAAIYGEGEYALRDLLKTMASNGRLSKVRGVAYLTKGKVKINPPQPFFKNLDELPFPDRSIYSSKGWETEAHELFFPMRYPFANMMVSRGCPGMCTFCQPTLDKIFGRPSRFRSPEKAIAEIKLLQKKYHVRSVIFWDDTLTANLPWLNKFCELIKKNNINIDWWCYSRVNNINQSVLDLMIGSGCKMICFGIESGSQRILNEIMHKGTTVAQNIKAIDLCHKNNILANANIMIGSPTETMEDLLLTDKLLSRTKPDIAWVSVTSPIAGTYLDEEAKKKGWLVSLKWSEYSRGQIGRLKVKSSITDKQMVYYHTKWHHPRFVPYLILNKPYFIACIRLIKCHLDEKKPDRIIADFIVGPIIEQARVNYWRYVFPLFNKSDS